MEGLCSRGTASAVTRPVPAWRPISHMREASRQPDHVTAVLQDLHNPDSARRIRRMNVDGADVERALLERRLLQQLDNWPDRIPPRS